MYANKLMYWIAGIAMTLLFTLIIFLMIVNTNRVKKIESDGYIHRGTVEIITVDGDTATIGGNDYVEIFVKHKAK